MVCQLRVKERTIFAIQQQAEGGLDAQRVVPGFAMLEHFVHLPSCQIRHKGFLILAMV